MVFNSWYILQILAAGGREGHEIDVIFRQCNCRKNNTGKISYLTSENLSLSQIFPEALARNESVEYMRSSSLGLVYWYMLRDYPRISSPLFDISILRERNHHAIPNTQSKYCADGLGTLFTLLIFIAFTNDWTVSPIFLCIGLSTWSCWGYCSRGPQTCLAPIHLIL